MELFTDTQIWLVLSFLVFLFMIVKLGKEKFLALLDSRIEEIRREVNTAESLHIEAQELLAQYQRKQRDAAKEADEILKNAKEHAAEIKKQMDKELKQTMKRREKRLQERLERMEQKAKQEIQTYAAELAVKATREIIAENMDSKTNDKLIDESIKNVSGQLN